MVSNLFKNFSGTAFSHTLIGRKASRQIGAFLDKFGDQSLKGCIERRIWLTDCLPEEYKASLKKLCLPYRDMLPAFTNIEVYGWIPEKNRALMESCPGGKQWALQQLQIIREYLSS